MACISIFHKTVPDTQQLKRTIRDYDFDCNCSFFKLNVCNLGLYSVLSDFHTDKLFFVQHWSEYETSDNDRKVD